MSFRNKLSLLSVMVVATLLVSAITAIPAYADDTPPIDSPDLILLPMPEEDSPVSQDEVQIPQQEDEQQLGETILAEIPEETKLVVSDESGSLAPFATEEAVVSVIEGDPIWCPVGVAVPIANTKGCSGSYSTFAALLADSTFLAGGKDGVIWIEGNYLGGYNGNDNSAININGGVLTNLANFKLTLKGGWNGTGTNTVNPSTPSTFDVPIVITNWLNDVTLTDIIIASTPSGANALEVGTTKNIILTNVQSNNNTGKGAYLHNGVSGTGNVTITNSQFKSNTGTYGLLVESNGVITLKDVIAQLNANGYGAYLDNDSASTPKAVTLSGTNTFNNNGTATAASGLYITSKGQITVNNLTASNNGKTGTGQGAELYNNVGSSTAGITLTGTNIFSDNQGNGLSVVSFGAIKANNLYANSNGSSIGAYLFNSLAATTQPVTLSGTNEFKYNTTIGLFVSSKGLITLNNVSANSNGNVGASLNNTPSTTAAGITLTGTNSFNSNFYTGLNIQSFGAVLANNVTANGNGASNSSGYGVSISNGGSANFKGVTFLGSNSFNSNYQEGLTIVSSGVVSLSNITANNNKLGNGAVINNTASTSAFPKAVTLSGTNQFNNNYYSGLTITTYGAITTNNISANNNGQISSLGSGVDFQNGGGTTPQNVTMNGVNNFNNNDDYGLLVISKGAILTNTLTASDNGGYGAYLQSTGGALSKVTMIGTNLFTGNTQTNLFVQSDSVITVSNITANGSTASNGAQFQNTGSSSAGITLSGSNFFNSNFNNGLVVVSNGAIAVSNITANNNGTGGALAGAFLNNSGSAAKAGITLSGVNTFNGNSGSDGLRVWSLGNIKVNSVNASSNTQKGVSIGDASFISNAVGSVTLSGSNVFKLNGGDNLYITAAGVVTMNSITSTGSTSGMGTYIDNTALGTSNPKAVLLSGINVFDGNTSTGLLINSFGLITINNVTANNNLQYGAYLSNVGANTPAGVTLFGANSFNTNSLTGLYIETKGLLSSAGITANGNSDLGAALNSNTDVTLKGSNLFSTNVNGGLNVFSNGVITINNLSAILSTSGYGATLNNLGTPINDLTPKGITLSGTNNISSNRTNGLVIDTYGSVLINALTASNNGFAFGKGADIDNNIPGASIAANVTLTGVNSFVGNHDQGLYIDSFGSIVISNLTASDSVTSKGAELLNNSALSNLFGVTLTGVNNFLNNFTDGLYIQSKGAVTLAAVTASLNSSGVYINNTYAGPAAPKPISFAGTNNFSSNSVNGLVITSNGVVTANNVTAALNLGGYGVYVDNSSATTPAAVNFTGTNTFNGNSDDGLYINSLGKITLNNLTANENGFYGLEITNNGLGAVGGVTMTGLNSFNKNLLGGISILSNDAVNLTRVTADLNGGSGLFVNTTGTFTLTCGNFNKNTGYGWDVLNASTATLIGVFSSINNTMGPSHASGVGSVVTVRNCPLP